MAFRVGLIMDASAIPLKIANNSSAFGIAGYPRTMAWEFLREEIDIWSTSISIQVPKGHTSSESFHRACRSSLEYFQWIDLTFSTYKSESEVSRLRRGELTVHDASPEVKLVWDRCASLRDLTLRAFDPWAVPGGFDPSGYVKGWAAQEALQFFAAEGITRIHINAGGDVVLRGGYDDQTPWKVGIRHPDHKDEIAKTIELFDGAIASSGTYERGAHIIDPRVMVPAVGARAATVIGPDAGVADALATALIVDGRDCVNWIGAEEFRNYAFWAVDKSGDGAWSLKYPETPPR